MTQLKTVANTSQATKVPVKSSNSNYSIVGPYANLISDGTVIITGIFKAKSGECPQSTSQQYADANMQMLWCEIRLQ